MRVAFYVRVSTDRQQQAQTIEQHVVRLREYVAGQEGWTVEEGDIFRDDGYSGAKYKLVSSCTTHTPRCASTRA